MASCKPCPTADMSWDKNDKDKKKREREKGKDPKKKMPKEKGKEPKAKERGPKLKEKGNEYNEPSGDKLSGRDPSNFDEDAPNEPEEWDISPTEEQYDDEQDVEETTEDISFPEAVDEEIEINDEYYYIDTPTLEPEDITFDFVDDSTDIYVTKVLAESDLLISEGVFEEIETLDFDSESYFWDSEYDIPDIHSVLGSLSADDYFGDDLEDAKLQDVTLFDHEFPDLEDEGFLDDTDTVL